MRMLMIIFLCTAAMPGVGQWEQRKEELQSCITGQIYSSKALTGSHDPIIRASRKYDSYTIQNMALETVQGLFVCASIYRPSGRSGPLPVVLVPNGHFPGGRYREDIQQICATLARMGAMTISYDLFGWGESRLQVREEDHYTPLAMKVQALNTRRILDYICSLPETDTSKIAITGASGGGSQTMLNTAIDRRIRVSVPVVMLSADFPGGCPCETGIPIHQCGGGTNNAEIAAMAAPRPQLVISCGKDWTKNVPEKEFPYLQKIYAQYGKKDLVKNLHLPDEGHDYGPSKRKAMYSFMATHLGLDSNASESRNTIEEESLLHVFDAQHPLPQHAFKNIKDISRAINGPNQLAVEIRGRQLVLSRDNEQLVIIDSISINHLSPDNYRIMYRGSDSILLGLHYRSMPDFNRTEEGFEHIFPLAISFKNGRFHFSGQAEWARTFTIHMPDRNDHFFGLRSTLYPENKKSPDLRGAVVDIEINGEQFGYHENFASAWSAFYFNAKGYASFVNSFARGRYHLAVNGKTSIHHETGKIDWYIFTGNHREIYSDYYKVIGAPKKVPLWSCGPIAWRDENHGGSEEIINDADQFAQLNIPLTAMMLDRPYSNGSQAWSKMDFNEKFAAPKKWISRLREEYGLQLLTWIAPATFSDTSFPGLLNSSFHYLDLTHPDAIKEFAHRLEIHQHNMGVKGHKLDRADEQFPVTESWYDGTPPAERKNKYVFLYARVVDSILSAHNGANQLNYARAAIHGSQRYLSGIWGGDPRSTWDGMASNLANSMRSSFMGFPNWGTDVGGYLGQSGKIEDELYIRWLQWGAFNGIFETKIDGPGGAGEDRAPWHCSKNVQEAFRKACETRMLWLPHIFSRLNSSASYGPLMKPLAMVYPSDSVTHAIWDEYIFGDALLVAPATASGKSRMVYLPSGKWRNYYTGEMIEGKKYIEAQTDNIPLFIQSNAIYFTGNIFGRERKYVDIHYSGGYGEITAEFLTTTNQSIPIVISATEKQISLRVPEMPFPGEIKIHTGGRPLLVSVDGKKIPYRYDNGTVIIDRQKAGNYVVKPAAN